MDQHGQLCELSDAKPAIIKIIIPNGTALVKTEVDTAPELTQDFLQGAYCLPSPEKMPPPKQKPGPKSKKSHHEPPVVGGPPKKSNKPEPKLCPQYNTEEGCDKGPACTLGHYEITDERTDTESNTSSATGSNYSKGNTDDSDGSSSATGATTAKKTKPTTAEA